MLCYNANQIHASTDEAVTFLPDQHFYVTCRRLGCPVGKRKRCNCCILMKDPFLCRYRRIDPDLFDDLSQYSTFGESGRIDRAVCFFCKVATACFPLWFIVEFHFVSIYTQHWQVKNKILKKKCRLMALSFSHFLHDVYIMSVLSKHKSISHRVLQFVPHIWLFNA